MPHTSRINWLAAKKDYIRDSTLSYQKIADKYGVKKNTVWARAKKENWTGLRQSIVEKASQKAEDKIVDELAVINARHTQSYTLLQAIALEDANIILEDIRHRKNVATLAGKPVTRDMVFSPQQLKFLTEAIDIGIKGERITKNMPTQTIVELKHSGAVAAVQLNPAQWESLVNATNAARDVING